MAVLETSYAHMTIDDQKARACAEAAGIDAGFAAGSKAPRAGQVEMAIALCVRFFCF